VQLRKRRIQEQNVYSFPSNLFSAVRKAFTIAYPEKEIPNTTIDIDAPARAPNTFAPLQLLLEQRPTKQGDTDLSVALGTGGVYHTETDPLLILFL
jgi:hypothetical protein